MEPGSGSKKESDSSTTIPASRAGKPHPVRKPGWISAVVGFVALLFLATGAFGQMQHSLNRIWDVRPKSAGPWLWRRKIFHKRA